MSTTNNEAEPVVCIPPGRVIKHDGKLYWLEQSVMFCSKVLVECKPILKNGTVGKRSRNISGQIEIVGTSPPDPPIEVLGVMGRSGEGIVAVYAKGRVSESKFRLSAMDYLKEQGFDSPVLEITHEKWRTIKSKSDEGGKCFRKSDGLGSYDVTVGSIKNWTR